MKIVWKETNQTKQKTESEIAKKNNMEINKRQMPCYNRVFLALLISAREKKTGMKTKWVLSSTNYDDLRHF